MNSEIDNSSGGILENVAGGAFDLITGSSIPAPIRKNAFKAFGQLCTAMVDIPVAHLEGVAAEKRAETQARLKIIETGADQIASQMDVDPEYARVAVKKYGQKIVREQINLDAVCEAAAHQLNQDSVNAEAKQDENSEVQPISDDWLNEFENEANKKSTEDMQLLFGRILAGEIQRPSSYSIKTVKLLSSLDNQAALTFVRLCSAAIYIKYETHHYDARVASFKGAAGTNSLAEYGLSFEQLNLLQEYGLIISDYNSWFDYRMCIINENNQVALPFQYSNRTWVLGPKPEYGTIRELKLHGVLLSRSGMELLGVIDVKPIESYTKALQDFFNSQNLQMIEAPQLAGKGE